MVGFFALPWGFVTMRIYAILHGGVLDILILNLLPFFNEKAADAQRADKTIWVHGGYHPSFPFVPNKAPAHRRFMAENLMYAGCRFSVLFFYNDVHVLLICVISHAVEAITIAWEQLTFHAPPSAMVAQTAMGVFSTGVTSMALINPGFIIRDDGGEPEPAVLYTMIGLVVLNWCLWLATVVKQCSKPKEEPTVLAKLVSGADPTTLAPKTPSNPIVSFYQKLFGGGSGCGSKRGDSAGMV